MVFPRQFQSSVRVSITFTAERASVGAIYVCLAPLPTLRVTQSIEIRLVAEGADVSRNVLNGPGWHENAADDRRRPGAVEPRRLDLVFRPHATHAFVHARANLENALCGAAAVVEQNDHIGPLRELDRGSLARVGVAAHGLDDLDRCFGPAYPLDDLGENFG